MATSRQTFIVAEVGVNHDGDIDKALSLVDVAAEAGADAVKFQTFIPTKLVLSDAPLANYQKQNLGQDTSQLAMLAKLQLSKTDHFRIQERCQEQSIEFMSTAFDSDSLSFLVHELGIKKLKIGSGEMNNGPFLLEHARYDRDIFLSTGMSDDKEIRIALRVLEYGYLNKDITDSTNLDDSGVFGQKVRRKVTLLQCTTQYPAPIEEANLRAMMASGNKYGVKFGYSDHTPGVTSAIVAVANGATVIEKHVTLDKKSTYGPDHAASLEPVEFRRLVLAIEEAELALGSEEKDVQPSEVENRLVARKSIVAAENIGQGQLFSEVNLEIKRPGTGLSPMEYWRIIGTKSKRDFQKGELVSVE